VQERAAEASVQEDEVAALCEKQLTTIYQSMFKASVLHHGAAAPCAASLHVLLI
jgi:hypothetical protein